MDEVGNQCFECDGIPKDGEYIQENDALWNFRVRSETEDEMSPCFLGEVGVSRQKTFEIVNISHERVCARQIHQDLALMSR